MDPEYLDALRLVAQMAAQFAKSAISPGEAVVRTHLGLDDAESYVVIQTTAHRKMPDKWVQVEMVEGGSDGR